MSQQYKVRLKNGRIIGPIDLNRVRSFIQKEVIVGDESAREYPDGDWVPLQQIEALAELILKQVAQDFSSSAPQVEIQKSEESTRPLPGTEDETEIFSEPFRPIPTEDSIEPTEVVDKNSFSEDEDNEKTIVVSDEELRIEQAGQSFLDDDKTEIGTLAVSIENTQDLLNESEPAELKKKSINQKISDQETVFIKKNPHLTLKDKLDRFLKLPKKDKIKILIAALFLGVLFSDFLEDDSEKKQISQLPDFRPSLPSFVKEKVSPEKAQKIYQEGLKYYTQDTVIGYRMAAKYFLKASELDPSNVKAQSLLASSYINLIDSSNKDENYLGVISRLIDLARAKKVELPETVIAEVEFYLMLNQGAAAQKRLIDYSKTHRLIGHEMKYYLALVFYERGALNSAARYLNDYPDSEVFSPKVFYLRGRIAEKFNAFEEAVSHYRKALGVQPNHADSVLRIVHIYHEQGNLGKVEAQVRWLIENRLLLPPLKQGEVYYLAARLFELKSDEVAALDAIKRAVEKNRKNPDYRLEYFTLKAKSGESDPKAKAQARMFFFLGEGEKLVKEGQYENALAKFLEARQAQLDSALPLLKIGDMFVLLNDYVNAKMNYEKAANIAKFNIRVWSKYIQVLIESYEWELAEKAMARFRKVPHAKSYIDKLAGDMYFKQGRLVEAMTFYRKAMARHTIDPDVYIAYAQGLAQAGQCKDAPFFFALARRFDPLNFESVIGTAECIAETKGVDSAIQLLEDELTKSGGFRAELFSAIAKLQIQKGDWSAAQQLVTEAMEANPQYAQPWKLQAQIYLNNINVDPKAIDRALEAYQSYVDRNPSDAQGYLERYRLYMAKTDYEKALFELDKIYGVYPKFTGLYYYRGTLYAKMGNYKVAAQELAKEVKNNPNQLEALIEYGKTLIELKKLPEAIKYLNQAMQVAPQSPEARLTAGWANFLMKNYSGAVALYQAALLYDKGNPLIYKRLGIAYRAMGHTEKARIAFKKYVALAPDASDRSEYENY